MRTNYYTDDRSRTDVYGKGIDAYIDNIDIGYGVEEHKSLPENRYVSPDKRIESYRMYTNLKIASYDDNATGKLIPGFSDLMMAHQDNGSYPYTVTKACVKYTSKDGKTHKDKVAFDNITAFYNEHHINLWMFEICGGEGNQDKFVIRFWNRVNGRQRSRLEVAVFPHVSFDQNGDMIGETTQVMDERFNKLINPMLYGDYIDDDDDNAYNDDAYDGQADVTYEMPGDRQQQTTIHAPTPSTGTGIVPMSQGSPYDATPANGNDDDGGTGAGSIVRSAIALVLFGVQAFVAYMIAHAGAITAAFGILTVLSLVTLIVSVTRRSAVANGKQASFAFPKAMSTILIVIAIIELVALVAVFAMYRMHALPGSLRFLYTTL